MVFASVSFVDFCNALLAVFIWIVAVVFVYRSIALLFTAWSSGDDFDYVQGGDDSYTDDMRSLSMLDASSVLSDAYQAIDTEARKFSNSVYLPAYCPGCEASFDVFIPVCPNCGCRRVCPDRVVALWRS